MFGCLWHQCTHCRSLSEWPVLLPPGGQPLVLAICRWSILTWHLQDGWLEKRKAGQGGSGKPIICQVLAVERCLLLIDVEVSGVITFPFAITASNLSLVTSSQHFASTGWRLWSYAPYLLLCHRPLATLSHSPPATFVESWWVEPRSNASGTSMRIAGSLSEWLVLLPPGG